MTVAENLPISRGTVSDDVRIIQSILAGMACKDPAALGEIADHLGTWGDGYGVDGVFGGGTEAAVKLVQSRLNRRETGIVDAGIWVTLTDHAGWDPASDTQHLACLEPEPLPPPPPDPEPDPTPIPNPNPSPVTSGGAYRLVVINRSSMSNSDVARGVDASKAHVDEDVAPYWGHMEVRFGHEPNGDELFLPILDEIDIPGAAGAHWFDGRKPQGVCAASGITTFRTVTHEIDEIIVDPTLNREARRVDPVTGATEHALMEICDPPQRFFYEKRGVQVTDFVLPEYFGDPGGEPTDYSFLGSVSAPYQIAPGGYQIVIDDRGQWYYVFASGEARRISESDTSTGGLAASLYAGVPVQRIAAADFDPVGSDFITHLRIAEKIRAAAH